MASSHRHSFSERCYSCYYTSQKYSDYPDHCPGLCCILAGKHIVVLTCWLLSGSRKTSKASWREIGTNNFLNLVRAKIIISFSFPDEILVATMQSGWQGNMYPILMARHGLKLTNVPRDIPIPLSRHYRLTHGARHLPSRTEKFPLALMFLPLFHNITPSRLPNIIVRFKPHLKTFSINQ